MARLVGGDQDRYAQPGMWSLNAPMWMLVMPQLGALRRFDATAHLDQLRGIPTLVLSAEQDLIFPPACGASVLAIDASRQS